MAIELDFDELETLINGVMAEESGPVPEAEPILAEEWMPVLLISSTPWSEHSDFSGVETRKVNAQELFNTTEVPNMLINQYRGFKQGVLPVPDIYEPNMDALSTIIKSEVAKLKAILIGDTGCGKTSLLEYYAAMTGRPFCRVVWDQSTDDSTLFGSLEVKSSGDGGMETYWNKSPLVKSMALPAIVVQDEISTGSAGQTMLLNPLLDRGQVTITSHDDNVSETIDAHPEWLVFATDNAAGNGDDLDLYNSRNVLDQAIINRFDLYQRVSYAPESVERRLITAFAGEAISDDDTRKLAKFSALCHKGFTDRQITTAFSVRNLMAICKLVSLGESLQSAIKINYFNRVAKSEQSDIAEMIRSIWGA